MILLYFIEIVKNFIVYTSSYWMHLMSLLSPYFSTQAFVHHFFTQPQFLLPLIKTTGRRKGCDTHGNAWALRCGPQSIFHIREGGHKDMLYIWIWQFLHFFFLYYDDWKPLKLHFIYYFFWGNISLVKSKSASDACH